jgi:hypothetical protein
MDGLHGPIGYEGKDKTLVVNKMEAEAVRAIFRRYLELQSFSRLVADHAEVRTAPRTVHREGPASLTMIPGTNTTLGAPGDRQGVDGESPLR